ncbi:MAG TPA: hypothetical protein DCM51_05125 [Actinobacteria bacterium]|jgi:hypothetical protein|nr:hypothetical protein [Actinomycetota bacterium]
MAKNLNEKVHVDLRVDGVDLTGDFAPGDDLPAPVAELLEAQGFIVEGKAKTKNTTTSDTEPEA